MHTNTLEDRASLSLSRMLVLVAALLFAVMLAPHAAWAATETVSYQKAAVNADKSVSYSTVANQQCTTISESDTAWGEAGKVSSYVASSSVSLSNRVTINGTVDLILADDVTLTISQGITVGAGNTLNIYTQSKGTGALVAGASAQPYQAGIGGSGSADASVAAGTINIHGGNVTATGGEGAAGIGGGRLGDDANSAGGTVTIYGGTIQATGGVNAAGIGGGESGAGGTLVVYGGAVTAMGGLYSAGIGGGKNGPGAKVSIIGGTVLASGGSGAQGIGCQDRLSDSGTLSLGNGVTLYCSAKGIKASDAESYTKNQPITRKRYMWTAFNGSTGSVQMARLYNPNSGEHFYTASVGERELLIQQGWRFEGLAWIAPESSSTPVYRLYNANGGDHHYTTSSGECELLIIAGWSYEDIGWYSDDNYAVPIYRQYNPNAKTGAHNFTTSMGERDLLIKAGWNDESIAFYGLEK